MEKEELSIGQRIVILLRTPFVLRTNDVLYVRFEWNDPENVKDRN